MRAHAEACATVSSLKSSRGNLVSRRQLAPIPTIPTNPNCELWGETVCELRGREVASPDAQPPFPPLSHGQLAALNHWQIQLNDSPRLFVYNTWAHQLHLRCFQFLKTCARQTESELSRNDFTAWKYMGNTAFSAQVKTV